MITINAKIWGERKSYPYSGSSDILRTLIDALANPPYSCMEGNCGACRAFLLAGRVEQDDSFALSSDESESGYILACRARPLTDIQIDFDA